MAAPRNSPIRMVAVEKLMLRPQMILGERVFIGFQYVWGDDDAGIPIKALIGGFGRVGIVRRNRLWQGDRLGFG